MSDIPDLKSHEMPGVRMLTEGQQRAWPQFKAAMDAAIDKVDAERKANLGNFGALREQCIRDRAPGGKLAPLVPGGNLGRRATDEEELFRRFGEKV